MHHLILLALLSFLAIAPAQKIFINKVPAYSSLPSCAVQPLSTIVRNMEQGCGDGGKTTSFSCFCTASSSKMESKISQAVEKKCGSQTVTGGVEKALGVFASYCAMGNGTMSSVPASTTANATVLTATVTGSENATISLSISNAVPTPTSAPVGPAPTVTVAAPSSTGGAGFLKGGIEARIAAALALLVGLMGALV
ncbi:uncharacterized protein BDR25DRAFT_344159 [Lindgomyces ingoldianus]|uniref:Uncharacterized protein n=1 Tax=Lindgomyces ingoldianus TaxID=673940 RepID=A0ACB6QR18_9PLEO|nr:uncharacterized protein BDR25DRAFT_344159 [Lindgomyces ingoldianus]KAF2468970.1 hypothetical protein BDR25DRAFT_344159 [Lindgomyces ingoldianus]